MTKKGIVVADKSPPHPPKRPVELKAHGDVRVDPFYWLRERDNPEVRRHLEEENDYLKHALSSVKPLQEKLLLEMKARIRPEDSSVPEKIDDYFYYVRFESGGDYPIYCRRYKTMHAPEQVILDVNELAKGKEFFNVVGVKASPDHSMLSFAVDEQGRNLFTIRFKDLKSDKLLPQQIEQTAGSYVWGNDSRTILFVRQDSETLRPDRVFRLTLDQIDKQELVFQEKYAAFQVSLSKDKLRKYVYLSIESTLSTEVRILSADRPEGKFKIFQRRLPKHEYTVEFAGDRFLILTNRRAKNFKLAECPENKTGIEHWKTVIPSRPDVLLEGFEVFKDYIVLGEMEKGLSQIQIWSRAKNRGRYLDFPDRSYTTEIRQGYNFDTTKLRYSYESLKQPYSVYEYDMTTHKTELLREMPVLGGFRKDDYETERVWAPAADGEKIPVSLLFKKGTELTGKNPILIEGYGAYGVSSTPQFRSEVLSLVDRGFVFAIASVRGGSELGRGWYEDGKLLKKKNTFYDFIAVTKYLQAKRWSSPSHTYAIGYSAGGLLIGAVLTMRPELYNAVILGVPFLDMMTTMMNPNLPLTTLEYEEWGDPRQKKFYDYMRSYSPYDQLVNREYPHVLVTTGFHDSQVQYWESAKFVAKLRDVKTDSHLALMSVDFSAGHGGKTGRYQSLDEQAMVSAFLLFLESK